MEAQPLTSCVADEAAMFIHVYRINQGNLSAKNGRVQKKIKENMKIFVAIPIKLRPAERKKGEIFML